MSAANHKLESRLSIYCCACASSTNARLTNGREIYPHRADLHSLPFWKCDKCNNFVGCHHKTKNRTNPLGCIPTKEIKAIRIKIHAILDPIWKEKIISRGKLYSEISKRIGWSYHTAEIRSADEANKILEIAIELAGDTK